MKKFYSILVFILLFIGSIFSQKETNNWIFGFGEWLNFNTEPPMPEFSSNFNFFAENNNVSMSDQEGNLLFYSNGLEVFNSNHEIMPNGFDLLGTSNSTNPVFTIAKPGSDNIYYLITADRFMPGNGLRWSELDMSLNGGLGDITSNKNILLTDNTTGKVTAVQHSNLKDIWIVHHLWDSNTYQAWLVTEDGFSSTPIESHLGSNIPSNSFNIEGQIKTAPSGNKIAVINSNLNNLEIFDFDRTTGNLFNPVSITAFLQPYGVEFSQKEQYIYVTQAQGVFSNGLVQLDLHASDIAGSMVSVGVPFNDGGALQLASNGKIYHARFFDFALGVINNPDEESQSVDYNEIGQELIMGNTLRGLPSFFHSYFQRPFFTYEGFCLGGNTDFHLSEFDQPIDSVTWDFGDPTTGIENFSTSMNPSHLFSNSGSYEVVLTVYSGDQTYYNTGAVHIAPVAINLGPDQTVCSNTVFTMNAFTPNATYSWSTGATSPSIATVTPGTFTVEVSVDTCGVLIDEITIDHIPAPSVDLGPDRGLCGGMPEVLDVTNADPNITYLWNTNSTTSSITVFVGGNYSVTATAPNGCTDVDHINLQFDEVIVNTNQANLDCYGAEDGVAVVFPQVGLAPFSFEWSDGDTLYTNNQLAAGTYTVTVTDNLGCTVSESFEILEPPAWNFDIIVNNDNSATSNPDGAVYLNPSGGTPPYTFEWDAFGEVSDPKFDLSGGIYSITVTDSEECSQVLEIIVEPSTTSLDEISLLENTQIFPNPSSDFIFIKMPSINQQDLTVELYNTLGQRIRNFSFLEKNNQDLLKLEVSDLEENIYFLKIKIAGEERVWKINVIN